MQPVLHFASADNQQAAFAVEDASEPKLATVCRAMLRAWQSQHGSSAELPLEGTGVAVQVDAKAMAWH